MSRSLIRKNQLHPDIADLVSGYGTGFFITPTQLNNAIDTSQQIITQGAVLISGDQTLSGLKNFVTRPTVNGTGVLLQGEAVGGSLSNVVFTTGNQIINGEKIFKDFIIFSGDNIVTSGNNQQLFLDNNAIGFIKDFPLQEGYPYFILSANSSSPRIILENMSGFYGQGSYPEIEFKDARLDSDINLDSTITKLNNHLILFTGDIYLNFDKKIIFDPYLGKISPPDFFSLRLRSNLYSIDAGKLKSDTIEFNASDATGIFKELSANNLVYNTGNQTISGPKTFRNLRSGPPTSSLFDTVDVTYWNGNFRQISNTQQSSERIDNILIKGPGSGIFSNPDFPNGGKTVPGPFDEFWGWMFAGGVKSGILQLNQADAYTDVFESYPPNFRFFDISVMGTGFNEYFYLDSNTSEMRLSKRPTVNGTGVLLQGEAVGGSLSNVVFTTGNQTVSGIKSFSGVIYAPELYVKMPSIPKTPTFLILTGAGGTPTGTRHWIPFNNTVQDQEALSNFINSQYWRISGRNGFSGPYTNLTGDFINTTGFIDVPLSFGNSFVYNFVDFSLDSKLKKIERSGVFALLSGERIGIGTFTPTEKLDVSGTIKSSAIILNTRPFVNGTGVLLSGEAVDLSTNQTISGTKTFIANSILYSGINVNFDNNTNVRFSGQVSFTNDRVWTTGISAGSNSYTIPYVRGAFSSIPTVLVTLDVTGSTVFNYNIKNRTTSQFTLLFPSNLAENVTLNIRATV